MNGLATLAETAGILSTWQTIMRGVQPGKVSVHIVKGNEVTSSVVARMDTWSGDAAIDRLALKELLRQYSAMPYGDPAVAR